mmetsp:Transcript_26088/g.61162  ORF Transcript_26088/g.61162 Transcript_26088/m.61162 type:complete len:90 (+) Transcript_26088:718-987(+)
METCPTFARTSVSAPRRGSATPDGEALVTFSFLPPALLEKTGALAVTRKLSWAGDEAARVTGETQRLSDTPTQPHAHALTEATQWELDL